MRAKMLDEEKNEFVKKQREMIAVIKDDYQAFVRANNKRKKQEEELKKYQDKATEYQHDIDTLSG